MNSPEKTGSARQAAVWSAVDNGLQALIAMGTLVLLTRYLAPADFGLYSMALAVVEVATLITATLFHDALIQKAQPQAEDLAAAQWGSLAVGIGLAALCALAQPVMSQLAADARGGPVLAFMALSLPAAALASVNVALLRRELQLKTLAMCSIASRLAGAAAAVVLMIRGTGVWALVAQHLVAACVGAVLIFMARRPQHRWRFQRGHIRSLLAFGLPALGGQLFNFSAKRLFVVLVGSSLGTQAAGILNLAFRLTETAWSLFSVMIGQVALPLLSRLQAQPALLLAKYRQTTELASLVVALCFGLLAAAAPEVVVLVFGAKWLAVVPAVQILAWVIFSQLVRLMVSVLTTAQGRPGINASLGLVECALIPVLFLLMQPATVVGAVALWAVREVMMAVLVTLTAHRQGLIPAREQWRPALPACWALGWMTGIAWAWRHGVMPAHWSPWLAGVLMLVVCTAAFGLAAYAWDRGLASRVLHALRPRMG